ncbi:IS110 family transposase [Paenibacillus sp. SI8]|uniref:IS110 family transposase n=1 Tax=unclassified Paenibacillus TaxID=185978 RepID=UPI003466F564
MQKQQLHYAYVGVDLHKSQHTAVILNCWNEKLGEIQFDNTPAAFPKLLAKVQSCLEPDMKAVYGLEDTGGYGWAFGLYLIQSNQWVKSVNPAFSSEKRKGFPTVHKSDSWDAECVARVLRDDLNRLPDFKPDEHYWVMRQLSTRRSGIVKSLSAVIRQLHVQLSYTYPSYRRYFSEIDGKTALAFWRTFPSPRHLEKVTAERLAEFLRKHSNNACSTKKAEQILRCIEADGQASVHYVEEKELVIRSLVKQIRYYLKEITEFDAKLRDMLEQIGCQLHTITGVDVVTSAELVSEIGDISRFVNADKLARYAGIAPIFAGSGSKGKYYKSKQGDRSLHSIFMSLAIRQLVVHRGTKTPRNPLFHEYFHRKLAEGKTKKQAFICVMRRLVNIVYGILKSKTVYRLPEPLPQAENQ